MEAKSFLCFEGDAQGLKGLDSFVDWAAPGHVRLYCLAEIPYLHHPVSIEDLLQLPLLHIRQPLLLAWVVLE